MLTASKFIRYLIKTFKTHEIHCFFLKNKSHFKSLLNLFFTILYRKKKLYIYAFDFYSRIRVQKYCMFSSCYNFFNTNISDFYRYFTAKIKLFEPSYLRKKSSYASAS